MFCIQSKPIQVFIKKNNNNNLLSRLIDLLKRYNNYSVNRIQYYASCEICSKESQLIKHHISYFPEELISICQRCHYNIHKRCKKSNTTYLKPPKGHATLFYSRKKK